MVLTPPREVDHAGWYSLLWQETHWSTKQLIPNGGRNSGWHFNPLHRWYMTTVRMVKKKFLINPIARIMQTVRHIQKDFTASFHLHFTKIHVVFWHSKECHAILQWQSSAAPFSCNAAREQMLIGRWTPDGKESPKEKKTNLLPYIISQYQAVSNALTISKKKGFTLLSNSIRLSNADLPMKTLHVVHF